MRLPSCTCMDWWRHLLPCPAFLCCFTFFLAGAGRNLSAVYRNNPLFTFDEVCLGQYADLQGKEVLKKSQENDTSPESCTSSPDRCPSPAAPSENILTTPKAEKREKCGTFVKEDIRTDMPHTGWDISRFSDRSPFGSVRRYKATHSP